MMIICMFEVFSASCIRLFNRLSDLGIVLNFSISRVQEIGGSSSAELCNRLRFNLADYADPFSSPAFLIFSPSFFVNDDVEVGNKDNNQNHNGQSLLGL